MLSSCHVRMLSACPSFLVRVPYRPQAHNSLTAYILSHSHIVVIVPAYRVLPMHRIQRIVRGHEEMRTRGPTQQKDMICGQEEYMIRGQTDACNKRVVRSRTTGRVQQEHRICGQGEDMGRGFTDVLQAAGYLTECSRWSNRAQPAFVPDRVGLHGRVCALVPPDTVGLHGVKRGTLCAAHNKLLFEYATHHQRTRGYAHKRTHTAEAHDMF